MELVRAGRSPEELAKEFEPSAQSIRTRVRQVDLDDGRRQDGLTSAEKDDLAQLRRDNKIRPFSGQGFTPGIFVGTVRPVFDTMDSKLVAAAFGMDPEAVMIYLADRVDAGRPPSENGQRRLRARAIVVLTGPRGPICASSPSWVSHALR
ncbi:hypothetical protein AB0J35_47820 [Nonomuraea angiospora]|uniref:hypothetical protein n=1 Tax=Nonomuraea angiospora TaxID=46172 RepID=UPI00341BEB57